MDTTTAGLIYAVECILLYVLISRTIRTVWFRQAVLTVLPLCIALFVVHWNHIPFGTVGGLEPTPEIPKESRLAASVVYYLLMGFASGCAFRQTQTWFGFPLLVFFTTLSLHFYHLIHFHQHDTVACQEDEWVMIGIALCSVWTLREFSHLSTIAAIAMVPATSLALLLVYQALEIAHLHDRLFDKITIVDVIRKAQQFSELVQSNSSLHP